ncbi:RING finger [Lecanosticta acicola]|uniref:RING finger n=1 Tax=Lecanosticta acicola TaxID=111012 RepID=A0AAI8YTW6_9PEZI|nr:RING finger [Lecanosticta acicola]
MDGALPENDGMQLLRHQLQEIRQLAISTEEKAQRMHSLMMLDYMKHRARLEPEPSEKRERDISMSPLLAPVDPENPYELRPGDLDVAVSPLPKNPRDIEGELDEAIDDEQPELGCMHYKRNVKVQCYDCHRWFPCRHCHDQARDLPFPHSLNRKKTQNMLCMLCQTPQPAAEVCINCGEYAAWYYCPRCKLWDNDSNKRIYHCDDCGICRVGEGLGKDYVHCRRCNVCISISTSAAHPCIERATEGNCPLCLVPLFESRTPVVSLPCGHYMHGDCYKDLMAVTYRCPVCSKSAVNMELQWKKLDDEIEAQPMPDDDEVLPLVEGHEDDEDPQQHRPRQVWIGCNDCGGRCWTNFHWLGLKCVRCDSYNTNQMAPTAVHETEEERLMRQQQIHRHDFTGDAVLRDAGIGVPEPEKQFANSALEVPESPSQPPRQGSTSPRLASGAQSLGRYFVHEEETRRPSFSRFPAPSMPNLPTLSDMPRIPRMPHLPHLPNLRQNLPNMPNVELPRFSPYEMIDSLSRSLSPMRYYLRGLDREDELDEICGQGRRPTSVQSEPSKLRLGSESEGSAAVDSVGLWDEHEDDGDGDSILG